MNIFQFRVPSTRLLTREETARLRQLIADHGEHGASARLGVIPYEQTRALSGLPMNTSTVARIRTRLRELSNVEAAQ